jgi:hypothetical protein
MNEDKIWSALLAAIGNPCGAAGLMGNLYAESALNPKNLQQSFERKLGYTDDSYTAAVDTGSYSNFVYDSAGYGLAQWTYWSRKSKLLIFARTRDASIGDLDMQLAFLLEEIRGYTGVWAALVGATSVRAASDAVLTGYERPTNQGEAVKQKRASFGQRYFDTYAIKESDTMATVMIGSARIDENGKATGGKAGDQTGREVSTQAWYKHAKGWRVLRAKDPAAAERIAQAMQWACDSPLIGYDQNQRETLRKAVAPLGWDIRRLTTAVETDCSALVRVCCGWAFQQDLGAGVSYFNTTSMCSVLLKTGLFDELTGSQYTDRQDYLRRGDILCTRTQGHTAVVLSNGSKAGAAAAPVAPVEGLRRGDYGSAVTTMQQALLTWRPDCLPKWGADGDFGAETEAALRAYQAEAGLPVTGVYDEATRKALTAPTPEPPEEPAFVLATGDVNVRAEPGTDAPVIGILHKGYTAPYLGETRQWGGRDWYKVLFNDEDGWVSSKYAEVTVG